MLSQSVLCHVERSRDISSHCFKTLCNNVNNSQRFLDFARNDNWHRVRGRHAAATETDAGLLDFARNDGINRN